MTDLNDKVVLVTGAAAGIGRATALRLAADGAKLHICDVAAEGVEETAKLVSERGGSVEASVCDVSDEADATNVVAVAVDQYGRLDALCNIAGILRFEHFEKMSYQTWREIIAVNLDGPFLMSRAAMPHLVEAKGAIVNVGSTAGLMGLPYGAAYGASKGGVHAMTRSIAVEFASRGVRCNAVCPAGIDTAMSHPTLPEDIDFKLIMRPSALNGNRPPEVVASLLAFLISADAEHINGETIRVDGAALA